MCRARHTCAESDRGGNTMTDRELINLAFEASENAYAPYSGYKVGAALVCEDGSIYLGCNMENAAYGSSICAERIAIGKAISEGKRNFIRMAVAARGEDYAMPCGSCRQVINEFSQEMEVLAARADGRYVSYKLNELLPKAFSPHNLEK
ncbi:MAG: cytidine deaminase [Papillibacter sp.]|nr:cytidine deaminase [Papillibacter sp.]